MTAVIDMSRWQGVYSVAQFKSVLAFGVKRAVIKAGGADSGTYKDADHDANVANARAAGLGIDHYWFNGPGDPAAHARLFLQYAQPRVADKLWYDIENEGSMPHATPANALTFGQTTKSIAGILAGLYMSSSVTKAADWSANVAAGQELWVADYGANTGSPGKVPTVGYWKSWTYWQYTSVAHIGALGPLDESLANGAVVTVSSTTQEDDLSASEVQQISVDIQRGTRARLFYNTQTKKYFAVNWNLPSGDPSKILYANAGAGQVTSWYNFELVGDQTANAIKVTTAQENEIIGLAHGTDSAYNGAPSLAKQVESAIASVITTQLAKVSTPTISTAELQTALTAALKEVGITIDGAALWAAMAQHVSVTVGSK